MPRRFNSNREFWLAVADALRSGAYHQTTSTLFRRKGSDAGHCCLGVACDIDPDVRWSDDKGSGLFLAAHPVDGECPKESRGAEVEDWPPVPDNAPYRGMSEEDLANLATMNDQRKTFDQIADKIDEIIADWEH